MNLSQRIFDTIFWSILIWNFGVRRAWPWDLRGKRKQIKLKTRNREF